MPTYILYDKASGDIVHVHQEYFMGSDKTVELSEERVMSEVAELLPKKADIGLVASDEPLRPVRGHRHYVDLTTGKLMLVKTAPRKRK